jgi:hypothetical protein
MGHSSVQLCWLVDVGMRIMMCSCCPSAGGAPGKPKSCIWPLLLTQTCACVLVVLAGNCQLRHSRQHLLLPGHPCAACCLDTPGCCDKRLPHAPQQGAVCGHIPPGWQQPIWRSPQVGMQTACITHGNVCVCTVEAREPRAALSFCGLRGSACSFVLEMIHSCKW